MSLTGIKNESCIRENDIQIDNSVLNYVMNLSPFESNSQCETLKPSDTINPREYNLYSGKNQGMTNTQMDYLVNTESELFNLTRNLSVCASKKYKPSDCHSTNSECAINTQSNNPAVSCPRIQTNVSRNIKTK